MSSKDRHSTAKGVLFLDYLQFSLNTTFLFGKTGADEIPLIHNKAGDFDFVLIKQKFATPIFHSRFYVYYDGAHVADLLTDPKYPEINAPHLVSIRMANHLQYCNDLWPVTDLLIKHLHGVVNNITRLDIAMDYQGEALQVAREFKKENVGLKGGKTLGYQQFCAASGDVKTMNIGGKSCKKSACIYDKTLELKKSNKLYIEKSWKKNGLTAKDEQGEMIPVTRIELRLKNDVFQSQGIKFEDLRRKDIIKDLFCTNIASLIRFFKKDPNHPYKRTNLLEKINILPRNMLFFNPLRDTKKMEGKITWRKKVHVKSAIEEFFNYEYDYKLFERAFLLADDYGLDEWFFKKIEMWFAYFYKLKKNDLSKQPPDIEKLIEELNKRTAEAAKRQNHEYKAQIVARVYEWREKGGALKKYKVDVWQMMEVFKESEQTEMYLENL